LHAAEEDDEYDDTYDDVYDPMGDKEAPMDKTEEYLMEAHQKNPACFHPSYRKSQERKQMREYLSWTDEQIEGWFVMLNRDVRVLNVAYEGQTN
jgi:hypothetical protein